MPVKFDRFGKAVLTARGETSVIDVFHDAFDKLVKVTETSYNGKLLHIALFTEPNLAFNYTDKLMAAKPNYWRNW